MRALIAGSLLALAACAARAPSPEEAQAIGEGALKSYLDAVNSNDAGRVLDVLTPDAALLPPHEPAVIGKAKIRPWAEGYFSAYAARWEKTLDDVDVTGGVAVLRYRYHSFDTSRTSGVRFEDVGKGLAVFRRGDDGRWRVSSDAWSSDNPITAE